MELLYSSGAAAAAAVAACGRKKHQGVNSSQTWTQAEKVRILWMHFNTAKQRRRMKCLETVTNKTRRGNEEAQIQVVTPDEGDGFKTFSP